MGSLQRGFSAAYSEMEVCTGDGTTYGGIATYEGLLGFRDFMKYMV